MPITRTDTLRSKSPAPNFKSLTPKFMPPSHYAVAGGYTTRQITNRDVRSQGEHGQSYGKPSATSKGLRNLTPGNPPRTSAAVHASSESESSMVSNLEDHVPDLRELRGTKNGFPELEAQLLPSLRDTIDRMTGTSSRTPTRTTGTRTGDRVKNWGTHTKGLTSPGTVSGMHDHHALGISGTSNRQHFHNPKNDTPTTSHPCHLTPTQETSSRLKTPTKSALKSSLRSPSTKAASTVSGTPKLPESFNASTPSPLKSMKTLLTRKCSGKLRSPFNPGHKPISSPPQKDPGSEHQAPDRTPCSRTRTDQSNIPRLRIRLPDNNFCSDDSDFEHRFEVESRDRRKLTVTNAEVFVSESSSECDTVFTHDATLNSRAVEVPRPKYLDSGRTAPVGLGLSLTQTTHTESHLTRNDEGRQYLHPGKNLRFSLPPSNSGESTYSDDFGNYAFNTKNAQSRIQESYVPADADLDFNCRHPSRISFLRHHGNVQQSGVGYFPDPSIQILSQSPVASAGNENQETESERDGYSVRRLRTDTRRRSSSCGPSFRESPQDTTRSMYGDPPTRPRSSSQRHIAREDYTPDREFPTSLKELIQHRNSSSKPLFRPGDAEQGGQRKRRSADEAYRKWGRKEKPASASNSPRGAVQDPSFYDPPYFKHYGEGQQHWADANSDNESFRSVATRERLAFGIPPSESDEVFSKELREPELSHADSNMSSINECLWKEAHGHEDGIGINTDRMIRKLNVEKEKVKIQRGTTPRLNIISPTLSSESLTHEDRAASAVNPVSGFEMPGPDFRTTPVAMKAHVGHQDFIEVPPTREGVIQEIFESEEDLLHLLQTCMRLFVIPLRVQNSRTWITGVPPTVARLLDWFDDIVHLHEQIYEALCSARDTMSPATDRVSESLRWFVLRIEVYQPYLVKLADARLEIHAAREDQQCELGQFIRLQEMNRECLGWTLERLLMLPVNRLAGYQDLFARMLDLTPKTHQDYLSTLSLSRSTDIALKVVTEVKAREDEYNLLKEFSSRIQGLPTQNQLATRDRKLLHSGPLQLVVSNLHELPCRTATSSLSSDSKRISRSSKLLDAIAKSPCDMAKSAVNSGPSWTTNGNDEGPAVSASSPSKVSWFSRLPLRRRSRAKSPSLAIPGTNDETDTVQSIDLRTVDVHGFVFNDLVLLVQQNRSNASEPSWILSEDVGIFRPLSIARLKRRNAQEGMILSLEVATVDPQGLNDTFNFRSSSWRIIDLLLRPPSRGGLDGHVNSNDHFQPWLNSLRQCCKHILRKLTFITHPTDREFSSVLGSDRRLDTHLVVSSLTASGLPIPRSPSGNLPETRFVGGDRVAGSSDEREERGWWSLRYQQVFREFQRQDSGFLDDDEED